MESPIKNFYGKILGYVESLPNGDKIYRNFYRKILYYYRKNRDVTTDFYNRILAQGDIGSGLLYKLK